MVHITYLFQLSAKQHTFFIYFIWAEKWCFLTHIRVSEADRPYYYNVFFGSPFFLYSYNIRGPKWWSEPFRIFITLRTARRPNLNHQSFNDLHIFVKKCDTLDLSFCTLWAPKSWFEPLIHLKSLRMVIISNFSS